MKPGFYVDGPSLEGPFLSAAAAMVRAHELRAGANTSAFYPVIEIRRVAITAPLAHQEVRGHC